MRGGGLRLGLDQWIGYPRAVDALERLESLLTWPDKQRMPNLLILGPTNNGKSMIVEKFRRLHPPAQQLTKPSAMQRASRHCVTLYPAWHRPPPTALREDAAHDR